MFCAAWRSASCPRMAPVAWALAMNAWISRLRLRSSVSVLRWDFEARISSVFARCSSANELNRPPSSPPMCPSSPIVQVPQECLQRRADFDQQATLVLQQLIDDKESDPRFPSKIAEQPRETLLG